MQIPLPPPTLRSSTPDERILPETRAVSRTPSRNIDPAMSTDLGQVFRRGLRCLEVSTIDTLLYILIEKRRFKNKNDIHVR